MTTKTLTLTVEQAVAMCLEPSVRELYWLKALSLDQVIALSIAASLTDINACGIAVSANGDADTTFPVTIYPAEDN